MFIIVPSNILKHSFPQCR